VVDIDDMTYNNQTMQTITINKITFSKNTPFVLIAGPCVIESEEICLAIGERVKSITEDLGITYIFKASFDKANRTSIHSYRGPGLSEGLKILSRIKEKLNIPILTDIHESQQASAIAEIADILQIPAFLCRQTDLLVAAAKTGKIVNVKKGQFLSPGEVKSIITKLEESHTQNILITERGTFFGYNRLVNDFTAIPEMQSFGYPVIYDATHSVQMPGGGGDTTGGRRDMIPTLARAAVAVGIQGLFMEVHINPDEGLSDAANMFPVDGLRDLLSELQNIDKLVKGIHA